MLYSVLHKCKCASKQRHIYTCVSLEIAELWFSQECFLSGLHAELNQSTHCVLVDPDLETRSKLKVLHYSQNQIMHVKRGKAQKVVVVVVGGVQLLRRD